MGASGPTTSNERAVVYPATTEHGWAYQGGILGGGDGTGNPTVAVACWNVSGGNPGSLRGSTSTMTFTNTMVSGLSGGQIQTASFPAAIQLWSGTQYALGFLSTGHDFNHGMSAAANFANGSGGYTQPTTFYFRDVSAQPPTNPMGYTSSSTEGVISVFLAYQPNRAPTAAIVAPSGTVNTATPTVQVSFTDPDATAGYGDKLSQYRIQVRRASDLVSFWDATFTATSAEQAAAQTSQPYAGTALVPGTTYQLRAWVSDLFATTSAWAAWTNFTVNAGGTVTVTGPSGKQNVNTGITFSADWTHANSLSTQNVQLQLLQNGIVVQDSGSIAATVVSSASPGTPFTITWGQTGFANLSWGTAYTFQIRGQDTGGLWSSYSSPATAFSTDSAPGVATGLSPANNAATSSPPTLTATIIDPDGDAVTATARVKAIPQLVNPSFATDLGGWTGSSSGDTAGATVAETWSTAVYAGGGLHSAISASTAAAGVVRHVENTATWIPVVPGQAYTVRATYRTNTATLHPLLQWRWYNAARTLLSTTAENDWSPSVNTDYARSLTATAPVSAAYARVALALNTTASSVTGAVDADAFSVDQAVRTTPAMTGPGPIFTETCTTGTNDVFTISVSGGPTGGTFTVNVDGVSATLNWNSTAAQAQTALQALSTVGANLTVTGGALPATALTCTWNQSYAGTFKNAPTIGANSLTGGTSPTPSIAHTTSGVSGDLAHYGTYAWDCAGSDGTLTGAYPTQATFIYGQGPAVAISAPVANSTITTATPTITWTATGQVSYRIQVFPHGGGTAVYDSGTITSAAQSVAVPGGYLHGSPSTQYDLTVSVTNATPLTGNATESFTVSYTAPSAPTNFQATPTLANLDSQPSSVLCSWNQSIYSAGVFVQYLLDRRLAGTSPGDASTVTLLKATSLATIAYVDYLPAPDVSYTYSLRQQVTQGTDVTESGRTEATTSVSLLGIVICSATNGGTYRAVLSYPSQRAYEHHQDQTTLVPWGATAPTILTGTQNYQTLSGTFTLLADSVAQASAYIASLRAMYGQGQVVCIRDERDRKLFMVITKLRESDARPLTYQVDLEATECSFTEGV